MINNMNFSFDGGLIMKKSKGIAILLFAILLQLCSTGLEGMDLIIKTGRLSVSMVLI